MKEHCDECGQPHPRCDGHKQIRTPEQEAERARRFGGRPNFEPRPPVTEPEPCMAWPKTGANVCRKHAGTTPQARKAGEQRAERIRLQAEIAQDLDRLGYSIPVEDGEPIRAMRDEAAANVVVLRHRVRDLVMGASTLEVAGIYGLTYHQSGVPTGEARPHILVQMYDAACDRLAKLDEVCIKLGLQTRSIEEEERQGRLIADVLRSVFGDPELGLTPEQLTVAKRKAVRHLRLVETAG